MVTLKFIHLLLLALFLYQEIHSSLSNILLLVEAVAVEVLKMHLVLEVALVLIEVLFLVKLMVVVKILMILYF